MLVYVFFKAFGTCCQIPCSNSSTNLYLPSLFIFLSNLINRKLVSCTFNFLFHMFLIYYGKIGNCWCMFFLNDYLSTKYSIALPSHYLNAKYLIIFLPNSTPSLYFELYMLGCIFRFFSYIPLICLLILGCISHCINNNIKCILNYTSKTLLKTKYLGYSYLFILIEKYNWVLREIVLNL